MVVKYFLKIYPKNGNKHQIHDVEVYKEFNHGDLKELVITIESTRQAEILKLLKPYTTKKQRTALKEYGMKWGTPIKVLESGTYFLQ